MSSIQNPSSGNEPVPTVPVARSNLSPQEANLRRQQKIMKVAVPMILNALVLVTAGVGVALALVFANPLFLTLMVASVAFALLACVVYMSAAQKPETNTQALLQANYREVPDDKVKANFLCATPHTLWQNKCNPSFYLAIPTTTTTPYTHLLPVLYKSNKPTSHNSVTSSHKGLLTNPVGPNTNVVDPHANPLSEDIHSFMVSYNGGQREWLLAAVDDLSTQNPKPFAPTEVRTVSVTMHDHVPPPLRPHCPSYLTHVRGPHISDFITEKNGDTHYYWRAYFSYMELLEEALKLHSTIVSLPLFSALEMDGADDIPGATRPHDALCLAALVSAMNDFALSNKSNKRLLVNLQYYRPQNTANTGQS